MKKYDTAIVGGGLAGLVAAVELARAGKSVAVLEKSGRAGGRAMTVEKNGALFNLGVHAVYRGGAAEKIYQDLGVKLEGKKPGLKAAMIWENKLIPAPTDPVSILSAKCFPWSGKFELFRFFMKVLKLDAAAMETVSLSEWMQREIRNPSVRQFVMANLRAGSYTNDPEHQLIGPVIDQLQRGVKKGVLYVDGGWQSIVDQLCRKAQDAGADLLTGKHAAEIRHDGRVRGIRFTDGTDLDVGNVILTCGPREACRLVPNSDQTSLWRWKAQARPSTAACLDLCLNRLPVPNRNITLGIDVPVFFTNQSVAAKPAKHGQVVHIIKHNGSGGSDPKEDERLLERMMDLIQPGWEKEIIARQFLPNMVVSPDIPHTGRTDARPGPAVSEIGGLYVAGDWASHGEILSDAAAASGRRAARELLAQTSPKAISV